MPSKKKKYNARFPAGRIKKIMQTDDEVGKVAQAVPVIISRTLELFVESLIKKSMQITMMKNARTLSPHHMKQCILSESRFDFLRDLVKSVPEVSNSDDDLSSFTESPSVSLTPRERINSSESGFSQSTQKIETPGDRELQPPPVHCLNFYTERDTSVTESTTPIPSYSGDRSHYDLSVNDTRPSYLGNHTNSSSSLRDSSYDRKSSGVNLQGVDRYRLELPAANCDDSTEEDYDT